jgi:hypothetical protein
MTLSNTSSTRSVVLRNALIVLGCSLILAVAQVQAVKAADTAVLQPLEDKAPALPLTYAFEKVTEGENGPYILKLKNASNDAIKVSAQVLSSVTFHANSRIRNFPDHVIDPGQVWTITELAASDKVTVSAKGFAPLELTVP